MNIEDIDVNILIVDDRPENLLSLESIIEGPNRNIIKAESGNEALKLALKDTFALIITDVQMPEMDGFEMVSILRMNPKMKLVPIIFATAISKDDQYVHQGYSEGAVDYLFKPLDATVVAAKVDIFVTLYRQNHLMQIQNDELVKLNENKNKFLGMAAHDIRNPLLVIEQYSKFILEDNNEPQSDIYKNASIIHASSRFIHDLVDELLDVTKIESGTFEIKKENVEIKELIENSVKLNSIFSNRKEIEIISEIDDTLTTVGLDLSKINQVLNNLISNAIKYSDKNTKVTIKASKVEQQLRIDVIDQGKGVKKSEFKKLFEAFQTTSTVGTDGEKSTGLGLLIVKKIVEGHGGKMEVKSEVNVGSAFSFLIPLVEISNKEKIASSKSSQDNDINPKYKSDSPKIMFCEDDLLLTQLSMRVLKSLGITAIFAEDGKDGLNKLKDNPDIEYIFTDLNMPEMDGYELSKHLDSANSEIKVIALTGHLSEDIEKECSSAGMSDFLEKPISKLQLESFLAN